MNTKKSLILSLLGLCLAGRVLAIDLTKATIVYSKDDVALTAQMANTLADDIERVSGIRPAVTTQSRVMGDKIVLQTLAVGKAHPELSGTWERYAIDSDKHGVTVTGSDARGMAYGALHISEAIGVSPWYWWADIPVKHQATIEYSENMVSLSPTIKYRGLFINDEDWGMKTWSSRNYEKELNDIGPRTYDRVCELILRLRGNMLAPAMHSCTGAFYTHPESQVMADKWGIMITTSHCEPMLFNNASSLEWDREKDGDWNFETNSERILSKFDNRLRETAQYENIYTTGLRGLHDAGMQGSKDLNDRKHTLETVIAAQREILEKYKKRPADQIKQIFIPYKEALDIYDAGLRVPDDITLVWPDDNYGYMKRVSNAEEQRRSGGSGVYYHASYLGSPHDYLWIFSTSPTLMYEELRKVYRSGGDRYWLLNVGDIKPLEVEVQQFFSMAYDLPSFSFDNVNHYQAQWLASIFGQQYQSELQSILDCYYRLAWLRRPEFMGYEMEWDAPENSRLHDSDFSFASGSAQRRLAEYQSISNRVEHLMQSLPNELQPVFFELLAFQVQGACQMNQKFLMAQRNHETGDKEFADASKAAYDSINALMLRYNMQLDGKWDQMMSEVTPGINAKYQLLPEFSDTITSAYVLPKDQHHTDLPHVIDFTSIRPDDTFSIVEGIGVDWKVLKMGNPEDAVQDPASLASQHIDIPFEADLHADSITIQVNTVPFWPTDGSRSNRIGVSVDGCAPVVCENRFKEYSYAWKVQVLENRKDYYVTFPIDKTRRQHVITLVMGDPGQMVQRLAY